MTYRTIPEIRQRMYELAEAHDIPELAQLAEETRRRRPGRRAPVQARLITAELADQVRAFAARHPKMHQRKIGDHFKIDGGRVSEILHGKRGQA